MVMLKCQSIKMRKSGHIFNIHLSFWSPTWHSVVDITQKRLLLKLVEIHNFKTYSCKYQTLFKHSDVLQRFLLHHQGLQ